MPSVRATGLLGSLRWWYEATVRALGGWACDPTEHTCRLDLARFRAIQDAPRHQRLRAAGLCDACRDFGATGWRRGFTLMVSPTMNLAGVPGVIQAQDPACHGQSRWYLPGAGHQGRMPLHIRLRDGQDPALLDRLLLVLYIVARHAALGAKTGLGYGRFHLASPSLPDDPASVLRAWQQELAPPPPEASQDHLPDLTRMFFARIEVPRYNDTPWQAVADLKCRLRRAFQQGFSYQVRHFLFGEVQGSHRVASKIRMTAAHNGSMHVWGWVPDTVTRFAPEGEQPATFRERVMQRLYGEIDNFGRILVWREFDAPRDMKQRIADPAEFVQSLLAGR